MAQRFGASMSDPYISKPSEPKNALKELPKEKEETKEEKKDADK